MNSNYVKVDILVATLGKYRKLVLRVVSILTLIHHDEITSFDL